MPASKQTSGVQVTPERLADMTNTALPGPHPHQAGDIRAQGGDVARWSDPMEGRTDDETPAGDELV